MLYADERLLGQSEARFGPLRTFVMGGSDYPGHTVLARRLQGYLGWRNANARHPGVLAAQRRERARIRSERQQLWGRLRERPGSVARPVRDRATTKPVRTASAPDAMSTAEIPAACAGAASANSPQVSPIGSAWDRTEGTVARTSLAARRFSQITLTARVTLNETPVTSTTPTLPRRAPGVLTAANHRSASSGPDWRSRPGSSRGPGQETTSRYEPANVHGHPSSVPRLKFRWLVLLV